MKEFSNSLTKTQFLVFILLCFAVLVLVYPSIPRLYNSATSQEPEPWNPDNINSIRDRISEVNKDVQQTKIDLQVLPIYKQAMASSSAILSQTSLDSTNSMTLATVQTNRIIPLEDDYSNSDPNSGNILNISKDIRSKIEIHRSAYSREFILLINKLGFYTGQFPKNYVFTAFDFYPLLDYSKKTAFNSLAPPVKVPNRNQSFDTQKGKLQSIVLSLDTTVESSLKQARKRLNDLALQQDKLKDQFNKANFNINQYAVVIGIPFFIIAAVLMYWYGLRSNKEAGDSSNGPSIDPKDKLAFALNTITVLLLILSLLILGLSKVIAENTLAALLGTIGGYVLNNKNKESYVPPGSVTTGVNQVPLTQSTTGIQVAPPPPPPPIINDLPPIEH